MNLTKMDWLGFRTNGEISDVYCALSDVFKPVTNSLSFVHRNRGWMGYEQSADICVDNMHVGLLAYGGSAQKGWVSVNLSGNGCEWINDWSYTSNVLGELSKYEVRRADIALDTITSFVSHDSVLSAHRAGLFNTGGRPPKCKRIESEDPYEGRTVYIGDRTQAKFLRCYEKGLEMVKDFPSYKKPTITIGGVLASEIYRVELELKVKNGPLPLDLIERRDQYFAGAYPYLNSLLKVEPEIFVQRRERQPQLDLAAALENIKHQYGNTLFTALIAHQGDIGAVWEKIVGTKHSDALLAKGVLMVEHD